MCGPADRVLPVAYATATAQGIADLVAQRYDLRGPACCTLLTRGFNDSYLVTVGDGAPPDRRFVLRLSGHRTRGLADVARETAFLAHLHGAGVPVAAAVPTREDALFTMAALPDGPRAAVLFHHAEGRRPELDSPDDAAAQARTLARIHLVGATFPGQRTGRYRLDLDGLLHQPMAAVQALGLGTPQLRHDLQALADRLADAVQRIGDALTWVECHGDCHGLNARIATTGPWAGQAVFFDFDDGGFGYLAYDVAVHLWAQLSFGRRRYAVWHAFMAAYDTVHALSPADEAALPLFVAIRHIWLMGAFAGRNAEWGSETLSATWLEREVAFLLMWERERLGPSLL